MNEKNVDYLNNQIKYTGFGDGHLEKLKEKIKEGKPEFTLFHNADFGKDATVATLQFKKSDKDDMYFYNRYSLMLKSAQHPDPIKQTFYISNKEDNITLKEGYNLMSGRAVHKELATKEGEKYTAWLQLDFKNTDKNGNYEMKKFHQNYGYDLAATLAKHPIKELLNENDKTRLMESLQRGNRQAVTLGVSDKELKIFIEASPQFKSLNFFDSSMKKATVQSLHEGMMEGKWQKVGEGLKDGQGLKEGRQQQPSEALTKGQGEKMNGSQKLNGKKMASDDDGGEVPKVAKKNARRKGQSVS